MYHTIQIRSRRYSCLNLLQSATTSRSLPSAFSLPRRLHLRILRLLHSVYTYFSRCTKMLQPAGQRKTDHSFSARMLSAKRSLPWVALTSMHACALSGSRNFTVMIPSGSFCIARSKVLDIPICHRERLKPTYVVQNNVRYLT